MSVGSIIEVELYISLPGSGSAFQHYSQSTAQDHATRHCQLHMQSLGTLLMGTQTPPTSHAALQPSYDETYDFKLVTTTE